MGTLPTPLGVRRRATTQPSLVDPTSMVGPSRAVSQENNRMSDFPARANVVVIGAGIVGNCLVGQLARLGWTDLVL